MTAALDAWSRAAGPGHRRRRRSRRRARRRTTSPTPASTCCCWRSPSFPRDKICGDGLTPRAVKQLIGMGFDLDEPGWQKNKGLRIVGAGHRLELPWPELASFPPYGMVRTRMDLDEILARHAAEGRRPADGAHRGHRPGPRRAHRPRRRRHRQAGRRPRPQGRRRGHLSAPRSWSPATASAPGWPWRWASSAARTARWRVAARAYYETPTPRRPVDGVLAGAVGRQARARATCCPATAGSSASATAPPTSGSASSTRSQGLPEHRLQGLAARWLANTPEELGLPRREPGRPRSARPRCRWASTASRTTPAACCWSATPAAWSTRSTARASTTPSRPATWPPRSIVQALARPDGPARERVLEGYAAALDAAYGGYFTLGPGVRQDDRQPDLHEAGDEVRSAAARR